MEQIWNIQYFSTFIFFLYSFIGWVFEEVLAAFKYGRFVNRGFVNGPLCMKYGFCMIVILTDVSDLMDNPFLQFVMCFVIITVIQYVAAALVRKSQDTAFGTIRDISGI